MSHVVHCGKLKSRDIDNWWYNSTKCFGPEDRGIVIRHNETIEDLHNVQVPWSFDD